MNNLSLCQDFVLSLQTCLQIVCGIHAVTLMRICGESVEAWLDSGKNIALMGEAHMAIRIKPCKSRLFG